MNDTRKTDEHVLQQSLGTSWVLTEEVCHDCNTVKFAHLDNALSDFVYKLVFAHHPDRRPGQTILNSGHPLHFDEKTGDWQSVRLSNDGKMFAQPQVVFRESGRLHVHGSPLGGGEAAIRQMVRELADPGELDIECLHLENTTPPELPPMQMAIIRTGRNRYIARGRTALEAERVKQAVLGGALRNPQQSGAARYSSVESPTMHNVLSLNVGQIKRAVAKTALNFVCGAVGGRIAREVDFDDLRRFVLSNFNSSFDVVEIRDGEVQGALAGFVRSSTHTLILRELAVGDASVELLLYQRRFATVRLAPSAQRLVLPRDTIIVGLFDYSSRRHRLVKMNDDPQAFGREFGLF